MNEPPAMTLNYNSIIPLQVSYYGDLQKLAEHDSLVREPDNAMLFDRLRWYALLHRHCFPHYQPLAVHCHGENNRAEDTWLYLLKTGFKSCHSLTNWYSFFTRPVALHPASDVTRLAAISAIATSLTSHCHRLTLDNVTTEDDAHHMLLNGFRQAGWLVHGEPQDSNHILEVKGRSFDDYWKNRPGQMRSTVRRKQRRHTITTRIETCFDAESWADYEMIYAKSWKPSEGSPALLRELARQEAKRGNLRLGIAFMEGEPVAAQFWTISNGQALIHKLAHDQQAEHASPGTILTCAMFQHAMDVDHVHLIDFGTGDDDYKKDWMEDSRPRWHIQAFWPHSPLTWPKICHIWGKKWLAELARRRGKR